MGENIKMILAKLSFIEMFFLNAIIIELDLASSYTLLLCIPPKNPPILRHVVFIIAYCCSEKSTPTITDNVGMARSVIKSHF